MARNEKGFVVPDGVCSDAVIIKNMKNKFGVTRPHVLLIKRKKWPYEGKWAFPGGHLNEYEEFYDACLRETGEETHADIDPFCSARPFAIRSGRELKDPRGWYVAAAFLAIIPNETNVNIVPDDDAEGATWAEIDELIASGPDSLAFDHYDVLDKMVPSHLK